MFPFCAAFQTRERERERSLIRQMKPEKWISISVTSAGDFKEKSFETFHIHVGSMWGGSFWQLSCIQTYLFWCGRSKLLGNWGNVRVKLITPKSIEGQRGQIKFDRIKDQQIKSAQFGRTNNQLHNSSTKPTSGFPFWIRKSLFRLSRCVNLSTTYMRPHPDDILFSRQCARSGWEVEIFM